jgi:predicted TIM-barrel fold metal-dependent hydrolase
MIVDGHTHILDPTWPVEFETADYLVKVMDEAGVDFAITVPIPGVGGEDYREGNRMAFEATKKYPDRIGAMAHIVPTMFGIEVARKECEKAIKEYGFKGLKTHTPTELWYANSKEYSYPIVEEAIRLRVPIFFHCGDPATCEYSDPFLLGDLADTFPEAKIIVGHLGHRRWGDAIWVVKKHGNMYLDTSFAQTSAIVNAVKTVGSNRVLMGSDTPINSMIGVLAHVRSMRMYGISSEEIENVSGRNAMQLYGLKERRA